MLSLRAGGVGLNLQAADTVIMYDRCAQISGALTLSHF
jgi:SNF2 family DNA or RNA helicase